MDGAVSFFDLKNITEKERGELLVRTEADLTSFVKDVLPVIEKVKHEGDAALAYYAGLFDKSCIEPGEIRVTEPEFNQAFKLVDEDVIESIEYAAENIVNFHRAQLPEETWLKEIRPGAFAGEKFSPLPTVACYVPRGKGSFPSVVLMNVIPAVVANVGRIVILTPPGEDGTVDPASLVAAKIAGVTEVYKCGGAQAVAAVAYGTETVPRCCKIVGPGSPWVVAAKRILADRIHPGIPAGPSETIVFADDSANPEIAALDLLIEAEHGHDSGAFLVTTSKRIAERALELLPGYLEEMEAQRASYATTVLGGTQGGIILVESLDEAYRFINDYAPEHLQILSNDPWSHLGSITNASEILLGEYTPGTIANYVLGVNAVLPTSQAAVFTSPLNVRDFMKSYGIGYVTKSGYPEIAKHARRLATYEGFDGHARAVSEIRDKLIK